MLKKAKILWEAAIYWFEHGDLVPLIVIVSAVHYSFVLAAFDHWMVATSIGLMVDLGHFRTVRAAVRYSGANHKTQITRWMVAFFMTAVSISYQQRYYSDWWLSLPLPFLIVSLAWLQETDKATGKRTKSETPAEPKPLLAKASETKPAKSENVFRCDFAKSQNGLNAHKRKHSKIGG